MENPMLLNLPELLLPWFDYNKRDLPWRIDRDPYHIWLSEIMLQQTRVEAVKGYYARFLETLPDVVSLSKADDELLYKLWEGLGYYSRVRNLKKAAQYIVQNFDGVFPKEYSLIRALPGIGDYTAGAICSIAFDQKTPAVDGNVLRVFSRITNDDTPIDVPAMKQKARLQLQQIYPEQAGNFTQALMELGATICGPNRKPDCVNCPCRQICQGYQNHTTDWLPVRLPKKSRREEKMTVLMLRCENHFALQKRPEKGLLAGLWQFPNVSGHIDVSQVISCLSDYDVTVKDILLQLERKHIFTHIEWNMLGYYVEVCNKNDAFCWLSAEQVNQENALPTAFRQFWDEWNSVK